MQQLVHCRRPALVREPRRPRILRLPGERRLLRDTRSKLRSMERCPLRCRTGTIPTHGCHTNNNNSSSTSTGDQRLCPPVRAVAWSTATADPSPRPPLLTQTAKGSSWAGEERSVATAANTIAVVLVIILVYHHRARRLWEWLGNNNSSRNIILHRTCRPTHRWSSRPEGACLQDRCATEYPCCHSNNNNSSRWTTSTVDTRDCSSNSKVMLPNTSPWANNNNSHSRLPLLIRPC